MNYYWQLTQSDSLAEIKKECYLSRSCPINAKRMLLFMVEQVFLPMGEFGWCIMQIYNHSWDGGGGEEAKGQSFFFFLGPHLQHMEVPRLGVEWELQLLAYNTATAMWDLSCICHLHHSSRQHQIPYPLSEARDWTRTLMVAIRIRFLCTTTGNSRENFLRLNLSCLAIKCEFYFTIV